MLLQSMEMIGTHEFNVYLISKMYFFDPFFRTYSIELVRISSIRIFCLTTPISFIIANELANLLLDK